MARRLPSAPPILPGFSHLHVLGSGGFADVFLYEQNMPRRTVAVKVLLSAVVNEHVRSMFQAEANVMAQLSAHPSILTVYEAGVSADGRPYLVMELCSSSLSTRYRSQRLGVAEVLQIGVKIGSAIETAHRAGVLHRDIKPSNILMTAYGHPVLSDFGIAATLSEGDSEQAVGMSVPWSAPEVLLDESPGSVRSEVWSLAATVYSLLAGRSPFELPNKSNTSDDLMTRIGRARPEPIGRDDVPANLERLLASAMSRKPENRPESVYELIRGFQAVEAEMGVPQTPVEVAKDDWALQAVGDAEDRTRVRGVPGAIVPAASRLRRRGAAAPAGPYSAVGTLGRPSVSPATGATATKQGKSVRVIAWSLVVSAVLVLALGATATYVLFRAGTGGIPQVSDIVATAAGSTVEFSWNDPGLRSGDTYEVSTGAETPVAQRANDFVVNAEPGERVCITVTVTRDGKRGDPSAQKCLAVGT